MSDVDVVVAGSHSTAGMHGVCSYTEANVNYTVSSLSMADGTTVTSRYSISHSSLAHGDGTV